MSAKTMETIEMLENLLNSQITMGRVMDDILVLLDVPPAPLEELVEEILTPMADAVRQAGSRLGLEFNTPEAERSEPAKWDQMDAEQRKSEVKRIKATRFIAIKELEASISSVAQQPLSKEAMQRQQTLDVSMSDLMGSVFDMTAQAQEPTKQE